jgi:hypothetical protein
MIDRTSLAWAVRQRAARWVRLNVRGGAKGPLEVEAMSVPARAKQGTRVGPPGPRTVPIAPIACRFIGAR